MIPLAALAQAIVQVPALPQGYAQSHGCFVIRKQGTIELAEYIGDRKCVAFEPPRIFEGLWIDEFEGQAFIENATSLDQVPRGPKTWFNAEEPLKPFHRERRGFGQVYRVRFVGQQARDMNRKPLEGYGHFNISPGLVILNEMLSIEPLNSGNQR